MNPSKQICESSCIQSHPYFWGRLALSRGVVEFRSMTLVFVSISLAFPALYIAIITFAGGGHACYTICVALYGVGSLPFQLRSLGLQKKSFPDPSH